MGENHITDTRKLIQDWAGHLITALDGNLIHLDLSFLFQ